MYGLLGARRVLRVELLPGRCTACKLCEPVCEEGINPVSQSRGIECDNCGECVRHCPDGALAFSLTRRGRPSKRTNVCRPAELGGNVSASPPGS